MQADDTIHIVFATVATANRELGTFRVIVPAINNAITWTASPTDFSSVVFVVEKPMSLMITVEKEFRTPFGMAAANTAIHIKIIFGS